MNQFMFHGCQQPRRPKPGVEQPADGQTTRDDGPEQHGHGFELFFQQGVALHGNEWEGEEGHNGNGPLDNQEKDSDQVFHWAVKLERTRNNFFAESGVKAT